ncbi:SRPBCC family protein [Janibacter melonis]|uniref:SRPBCC family protein n=1 Tax=Janibacter melonis TaxID=262209 RepID=UPI00191B06A3|nr:SRPBCC family protein [Janibacter melonis]
MKIDNEALVAAGPQEVFDLINDVERVASCLPGAELLGREGDDAYRGRVGLRVGPIGASFEGVLRFVEVDEAARTMHLVGRGSDVKGNGDAEADVRLAVVEHPEGSLLTITTDLNIRGKFVQFGKGAIASVSNKILGQFATNMAALLEQGDAPAAAVAPAGAGSSAASPTTAGAPPSAAVARPVAVGDDAARRRLVLAATFVAGCVEGWILTRAFGRRG